MLTTPQRLAGLAVLVAVCLGLALLAPRRQRVPVAVLMLHQPLSPPLMLRDRLGGWIPRKPSWAWAYHLEDLLLGPRKPFQLDQEVFTVERASDVASLQAGWGPPAFSNAGAPCVWFLKPSDLKALRGRLQHLAGPSNSYRSRMSTAEGIGCSIYTGGAVVVNGLTNQAGLTTDYFARFRKESIDLFTRIQFSEVATNEFDLNLGAAPVPFVRTNLDIAAQLQVPRGCGVFLLSAEGTELRGRVGVILDLR